MEQLKAQHQELEEARLQLDQEHVELEQEIERHGDDGWARAMARDINRRIIEDNEALPHFTRVSQNIAAAMALLHGLLGPVMPEICTLLERAEVQ